MNKQPTVTSAQNKCPICWKEFLISSEIEWSGIGQIRENEPVAVSVPLFDRNGLPEDGSGLHPNISW